MEAARQAVSLLAAGPPQPLSENSRQALQLSIATTYTGIGFVNSTLPSGTAAYVSGSYVSFRQACVTEG